MTIRNQERFSKEKVYGLSSQMRRAAVSVPSNIAEGCAYEGQVKYLRFSKLVESKKVPGELLRSRLTACSLQPKQPELLQLMLNS